MKIAVKIGAASFALLVFNGAAAACSWCRARVRDDVYNRDFLSNLLVLLLPIIILGGAGCGLYYADEIRNKLRERTK